MKTRPVTRMAGLAAVLVTAASWGQQSPVVADPKKGATELAPSEQSPQREPLTKTDENGKSIPATPEKLVLADPDSKMYMPCRDPNDVKPSDSISKGVTLNPKASVLSEEAAKQHGFRPSAHKVDCPKQETGKK